MDRPNVGLTFNLCHWLRTDHGKDLDELLREARPHLQMVTINGADKEGDWDRLIQPLGKGDYDKAMADYAKAGATLPLWPAKTPTAIATGGFKGKGTDESGKPFETNERWTDTWVKMPDGKWQCVASHGSDIKQ